MFNLLLAGITTVLVEFLVLWAFFRKDPPKLFLYSLLVNSFTLPLATYSYFYVYPNLLLIETVVFLVEGVLLKFLLDISYPKAFLVSLAANAVTAMLGMLL